MSRHVCLVTPGHLSTNPRLVKEADALARAGFMVTVVCACYLDWAAAADAEFAARPWKIVVVRFGRRAGLRKHAWQRMAQIAAQAAWKSCGLLLARAFHPAVPDLTRAASRIRADLYIAHNLAALPAAAAAARRHGAALGFDAEDFHRGFWDDAHQNCTAARMTRALEDRYLPRCEHVTASSPGIARAYEQCCGIRPPRVVLNVFPVEAASREPSASRTEPVDLYWFSQTIGPGRGLETAVRAIALAACKPRLILRGQPAPGYRERLTAIARHSGVDDRLEWLDPAPPSAMVTLAAQHDVGLAAESNDTANHRLCLANKIFTYLIAGIPVVASNTPAQSELCGTLPGAMFLYDQNDPASLADCLDRLCVSDDTLRGAKACAIAAAHARYNWEFESAILVDAVRQLLEPAGGGEQTHDGQMEPA